MTNNRVRREEKIDPPPFLQSWGRVYAAVVLYLVALIAVLHWFTRTFNR